jgi:adenylate cyclase
MEVAAGHGAEVAVGDDLLQAAGTDGPMHARGTLSGPTQAQIRGRASAVNVWLWHSGSHAAPIAPSV